MRRAKVLCAVQAVTSVRCVDTRSGGMPKRLLWRTDRTQSSTDGVASRTCTFARSRRGRFKRRSAAKCVPVQYPKPEIT
eukprot:5250716-Prymnesium_polylepis.1